MDILKRFALLIIFLMATGCATVGPTIVIETVEPAEDFVVLCEKTKTRFIAHNSSRYDVVDHVIVTASDKEVDCGVMFWGSDGGVSVMHPTLVSDRTQDYEKDGVRHFVYNKTKLDILDEQKAKFEAGYWDKYRNPSWEYLGSRPGCGFPHQYFEYYKKEKKINVEDFKLLYQKPILECLEKSFKETRKYDPKLAKKFPEPSIRLEQLWESIEIGDAE